MASTSNTASFHSHSNQGYQFGQVQNSTINVGQPNPSQEIEFLRSLSNDYRRWKDNNPKRVSGTCEWLLKDPRFLQWQTGEHSTLLHVLAGPGCGKSVLARAVIDEDLATGPETKAITTYFFFKRGDKVQETCITAIKAILHQFYLQSAGAGLGKHAIPKYYVHGNALGNMFNEMWDIFLLSATEITDQEVVCVIDALDECEMTDRRILMTSISEYIHRSTGVGNAKSIRFMVTSRPYLDTEFSDPDFLCYHSFVRFDGSGKSTEIAKEIDRVIAAKIPSILPKLSSSSQQIIVKQLQSMENRTYLWLHLMFDHIKKHLVLQSTERKLQNLIKSLPPGVDEAYDEMLQRSSDHSLTKILLSLVLFAKRPLTLEEASIAFELAQADHECLDNVDYFSAEQFEDVLKELCGLLLSVHESTIYFLHETAREFLLHNPRTTSRNQLTWKGCIDPKFAENVWSKVCMSFLCLAEFDSAPALLFELDESDNFRGSAGQVLEWAQDKKLLIYAASNWVDHFRPVEDELIDYVRSSKWKLCRDSTTAYRVWTAVRPSLRLSSSISPRFDPDVCVFAEAGLCTVVEKLLQDGADANKARDHDKHALYLAASCGSAQIIRTLCDYGADINRRGPFGLTALSTASIHGQKEAAEMILQKGAEINVQNDLGLTPLHMASHLGLLHIVRMLLEKGADVNIQDCDGKTPLHFASFRKHQGVEQALLENGADADLGNRPEVRD